MTNDRNDRNDRKLNSKGIYREKDKMKMKY